MSDRELRMYAALKRITQYMSPDKLRTVAEKKYGLEPEEAIEMAYENVLQEAKDAIKGMRAPRAAAAIDQARATGRETAKAIPSGGRDL